MIKRCIALMMAALMMAGAAIQPEITYAVNSRWDGQESWDIQSEDENLGKVVSLSLGIGHSGAITEDGSLYMWGKNEDGELGNGTNESQNRPVKVLDKVVSLSLEVGYSGAITEDGSLYMWGKNEDGELGNGTNESQNRPVKVLDDAVSLSLGRWSAGAITKDGSLYMWGAGGCGQLGNGMNESQNRPVKVLDDAVSLSLGRWSAGAITKDGSLYMWGLNDAGQVGNGTWENQNQPVKVLDDVVSLSLGDDYSGAITKDGSLYMWGDSGCGQLGNGMNEPQNRPVKVLDDVVLLSLGHWSTGAITKDGSLYMWGDNRNGQVGNGTHSTQWENDPVKVLDNAASLSLRWDHSGAITKDGSLYMWGDNRNGQVGNGTHFTQPENNPVKVLENVASFSIASDCSGAITKDGSLYMWGSNACGKLGDGTTQDQYRPVKVIIGSDNPTTPDIPSQSVDVAAFSLPETATNILTGNEVRLSGRMQFTDILPTDTTDIIDTEISNITWKSSDEDIISASDIKCVKTSENELFGSYEFNVVMPVKKYGEVTITGTTRNGISASTKVEVLPKMTLRVHDVEAGENIYRHVCTVTLDSPDESFLEQFMPKLQIDRYILNEDDFISGSTGCETTKYIISEHGKAAALWAVFRSVSVGSDSYSIKYNGCTEALSTFSVQSDKQSWSDVKENEDSKINEDQSYAYNEIMNAVGDFRDKFQEFIDSLHADAEKKGGNALESSNKDLAKKLEEECGAEIDLTAPVFEDKKRGEVRKKFIYAELSKKLASIANAKMGSIKVSDPDDAAKNIVDNVVRGYHYIDGTVQSEDKKMELSFDITGMYNAYFGSICFTEVGAVSKQICTVNMTQRHLKNAMQQYAKDLAQLQSDAGDAIYSAMAKDLLGKSISDFAGDKFAESFRKYEPQLEKWGVKGILDFAANCYTVYEKASAIDVDKIVNNTDIRGIAEELEKVKGLLDIEFKGFTNKAAKKAGKKVVKAAEYLYKICKDYAEDGKITEKYSFAGWWKYTFNCPVEIYVHDAEGKQIGYAGEDDLYYDSSIMIEEAGDAKVIYIPAGKEVTYKINGTGYGQLNCSFEEYDQDGMAVGRLNYYDIDLTPESKIEAVIPSDGFVLNNSNLPITVNGISKAPDICLEAKDYEFMDIKVAVNDTDGGVFRGAGKYVPGDVVNLIAVPNSGYIFTGWYDGSDNFVSMKRNIEFAARISGNYIAKFMKLQDKYTITYNLDGGTVSGNPDSYTEDMLPVILKEPVRSGYIFAGWTGSNGNIPQKDVTIEKGSTGEKFYTANWIKSNASGTNNTPSYPSVPSYTGTPSYPIAPAKYSITYNLDGGTVSGNPDSYTKDMLPIKLKAPTRSGYTFAGWTGSNGNIPQKDVMIEKGSTGEKFYTANWIKDDETGTNPDAMESKSISLCVVTLSENSYTYDGKEKMPGVTVRDGSNVLMHGTDYTVTYGNNTDAGTASVTVKGAGGYAGEQTVSFTIRKALNVITAANIKKTATSKKRTLSIGAKDLAHANLAYKSNHKSVKVSKTGKVTTAKNFVGSAKITITAAETANYAKAVKKIKVTVKPARVKLLDVKNLSGNRMQVRWKKNAGITAYQIQYSASKKFKKGTRTITVPKKAKTSAVISKMKEGKKYYVRIRAYKNISGKIYRSKWSSVKSVVAEK